MNLSNSLEVLATNLERIKSSQIEKRSNMLNRALYNDEQWLGPIVGVASTVSTKLEAPNYYVDPTRPLHESPKAYTPTAANNQLNQIRQSIEDIHNELEQASDNIPVDLNQEGN